MRQTANSSFINVPPRKKQRILAADIQWCVDNKDTMTLNSFAENFSLLDKQYTISRYTSIINSRHLVLERERLQTEFDNLKKSEEFKLYWIKRTRRRTQLEVDTKCTEYVCDAAKRATKALSSFSTTNDTTITAPPTSIPSTSYHATTISTANDITKTTEVEFTVDISDLEAGIATATIIEDAENPRLSKDDAEIDLLMLGKSLNPFERSLVWGIKAGMRKLPLKPIKTRKSLGECELFTMYFDPILSAMFSNSDKNVLLRWSNVASDESGEKRPDATISEIYQHDFGPSLGYGEVKVARPTTDNYALCHDLLRLATLAKDTIDINKLQAALTFQINGFKIIFYLSRLRHDGMYIMQEIGRLTFPSSLEELASFVNLKNIRTLPMVTEAFWRLCQPVNDKELWKTKCRPTYPTIYSLIDVTKDRHRFCALQFE
ncbi:hypothetical protein BDF20DRAFT_828470 [Mycotypha africana]|uniref:uncharacterized protein n=1 Tax=Mycotypha africana TaxID=64632 RepID=UPI0023009EEC|nr:uncharacterized protein BDF20DRAFT_828470 [Mycotypha africana]KAI8967868.1 hypothetical protein BDF20DRAFT_828470 [Mycotypha africana]